MHTIKILLIRAELSKSQCCYKAMSVTIKFFVVLPSVISFSYFIERCAEFIASNGDDA